MLVASCSSCLSATAEVTRAKPDSSLVDQLDDGGAEQPVHLIAEPGLHPPGAAVDPQSPHKVGERMIPDRSLPSRVRFTASRPWTASGRSEGMSVYEGKKRGRAERLTGASVPLFSVVSLLFSVSYPQP